jgi:tight adherence protein B
MEIFSKKAHRSSTVKTQNGLPDYGEYIMSFRERLVYTSAAVVFAFVIGFIFYHNVIFSFLLTPFALFYPRIRTKEIIKKRKNELNLQFKEMLYSLSSSLSAGKSVETSFKEVLKDLTVLYPNPDTYIIREAELIVRRIEMNETVESALEDFSQRSHLEDVQNFCDILNTCKRTGGNMIEIIKNTSNIINDKIEIKEEINTLLASKKFEQKVLTAMPILMIVLLSVSAEDYMAPVFDKIVGRIVMTIAIAIIVLGYFLSKKIMNIKV